MQAGFRDVNLSSMIRWTDVDLPKYEPGPCRVVGYLPGYGPQNAVAETPKADAMARAIENARANHHVGPIPKSAKERIKLARKASRARWAR
jgi:hypothetical protein